ncbi:MAG: carbohydrate ABC transporter substrate-binding protein [Chloroflexi bacterium]|nr:carbohydrate ABC transporter substrate-binding protein [Chloroflexota bacterium]
MRRFLVLLVVLTLVMSAIPALTQDMVELRIRWYNDGSEGEVLRELLDRFEMENPDISVEIDTVPYSAILGNLPLDLAAGEGPDIARVTDWGGLAEYYLDMSPYLSDPDYWNDNFGFFLNAARVGDDETSIAGFQDAFTVTGPYINRTLFEQAGVEVPSDMSDSVSWDEWAEVSRAVAEALEIPYPMAMDRSGHRFAGPAISSGAMYFDDMGHPTVMDEGFRDMAERFVNWHLDGTMHPEMWPLSEGYAGANEEFANAELVFYMSGSWQVRQFSQQIGDAFDWQAVPNPCGPGGCTGMPGGTAVVGIAATDHPEEVARVMEYLSSEEVLTEYLARTLFVPAHVGLLESGVDYDTDLQSAQDSLSVYIGQISQFEQTAVDLQSYPYNFHVFNATRDRLTQAMVGELTLDEAIERIQDDVDTALAEISG